MTGSDTGTDHDVGGSDRSTVVVNGHSIILEAFVFVCGNDECDLEEQAYAAIRHAAANTACPAEKMVDDGLRADGGTVEDGSERRTTREERRDERPPFVDPHAEIAKCHFCGQTWEPTVVDGFDLSTEDEYYPKMVPVCPEHAGGCR